MRSIEQKLLYFKYKIIWDVNRNQAPIGVVWKTNIMHDTLRRFVRIISINAMKCQINSLHLPYSAPVIIGKEWHITPICEMLSLSDSFESYGLALSFMFDL